MSADVRVHSHAEKCVMSEQKCVQVEMGSRESQALNKIHYPNNSRSHCIACKQFEKHIFCTDDIEGLLICR